MKKLLNKSELKSIAADARYYEILGSKTRRACQVMALNSIEGVLVEDMLHTLGIHPTLLSHHLTKMEKGGILKRKREGKKVRCFAV